MKVPVKLGLFALALSASFTAGAALGAAVPEIGGGSQAPAEHTDGHDAPSHVVEGP